MRKYLIGALFGFLLAFPFTVFADEIASLVGEKVQAENVVVVNGKELSVRAVNIKGTTYSPNRAIADALGLNIKFEDQKVKFESKKEITDALIEEGGTSLEKSEQIEKINRTIQSRYEDIERMENLLKISVPSEKITKEFEEAISAIRQEIAELEDEKAALEALQSQ